MLTINLKATVKTAAAEATLTEAMDQAYELVRNKFGDGDVEIEVYVIMGESPAAEPLNAPDPVMHYGGAAIPPAERNRVIESMAQHLREESIAGQFVNDLPAYIHPLIQMPRLTADNMVPTDDSQEG